MAKRYAIIENDQVNNIVVAEEDVALENGWILCEYASPGWLYIKGEFIKPPESDNTTSPQITKQYLLDQLKEIQEKLKILE